MKNTINSISVYTNDKLGYNISIIVLQIMFFVLEKGFYEIYSRVEGYKRYVIKYMKNPELKRSKQFMNFVFDSAKANFSYKETLNLIGEKVNILQPQDIDKTSVIENLEIIPYETLWEIYCKALKRP